MKRIGVVTATRAEYGASKNVIRKIAEDNKLELFLFVTGGHLSERQGMTVKEIEKDGFPIKEKINILVEGDTPSAVSKTMGMASVLFADVFERNPLDMLVLTGDRYELLPIGAVAMNFGIPIAHISGGETTQGAIDEYVRHCLTKMSYLHFPACEEYRKRIIQMGESPERVFNFGDIGVENIKRTEFMTREEVSASISFCLDDPYMSVTFHPVTQELGETERQIKELLGALESFDNMKFVFTKANTDAGGERINRLLEDFVAGHENSCLHASLGSRRYLSLLRYSNGIIGNSSSGIIEAPALGIPTVNIGNRQKGRLQAASVVNCIPERSSIKEAIIRVNTKTFRECLRNFENPYQGDNTAEQIVRQINKSLKKGIFLEKRFYDVSY